MGEREKENQPHVRDRGLAMDKGLQAERKNNGSPPARALVTDAGSPFEEQNSNEGSSNRRRQSRGEIALAKNPKTSGLAPVGKRRFIKPKLIIEIRNEIISALEHFPRRFGEAWLIPVN